jgi:hypothetical protein
MRSGHHTQPAQRPGQQVDNEDPFNVVPRLKTRKVFTAGSVSDVPACVVTVWALKIGVGLLDDSDKGFY